MTEDTSTRRFFKATEEILLLLEKSKIRNEKAIDLLPGIFLIIDNEGGIIRSNDNFNHLFSVQSDQRLIDILPESLRPVLISTLRELKKSPRQQSELEVELGAQRIPYSISISSWNHYTSSKGECTYYTIVGKDLRELKKALQEQERLRREVNSAEQLQNLMIPVGEMKTDRYELVGYFRSAAECGGDFLHYAENGQHLKIWAGDVTGHGIGPAMVTGAVKSAITMSEKGALATPAERLADLHDCVSSFAQGLYWMTFQLVDFDLTTNELNISTAGHTPVYCIKNFKDEPQKSWRDFVALDTGPSHPLGVEDTPVFTHMKEQAVPGSLYLSFSDGIFEQPNPSDAQFGIRRVLGEFVSQYQKTNNLASARDGLMSALQHFSQGTPLKDDVSFWAILIK